MKNPIERSRLARLIPLAATVALLQTPANAELIHHWKFDEGSGNVAGDSAGNADGVIFRGSDGGLSWRSDNVRNSYLSFDGNNDHIDPSLTLPRMTATNNFTWAAWVNSRIDFDPSAGGDTQRNSIVFGNRRNGSGSDFSPREFIKFTPQEFEWRPNDTPDSTSHTNLPLRRWVHVAVVKEGNTIRTFFDGELENTNTVSGFSRRMPFFIGGEPGNNSSEHFRGFVDDVRLYDNALTTGQIQALAGPEDGPPRLVLINADTDRELGPLVNGLTINFDEIGTSNLSVRADTSPSTVGSVVFALDGNSNFNTENVAPYAILGDDSGDFRPWTPSLGNHTLRATPFSLGGGGGTAGASTTVNFSVGGSAVITGERRKWHKLTFSWNGPNTNETASTNPFSDYRVNVTFRHPATGKTFLVPGYYAADGNAAETSATSGNVWRAHFAPDETGTWTYSVSFRTGNDVAIRDGVTAGFAAGFFNGDTGSFQIAPTNKSGRDLRGKGRLRYIGEHHLQFAETGEYFLKAGPDAPENFFAYDDIDSTPNDPDNSPNLRKSWNPHQRDYDPASAAQFTWQNGKGTEILGVINYLVGEGLNTFSFLTFNVDGDDDNVFPHRLRSTVAAYENIPDNQRWDHPNGPFVDRFDVSKMDQWERVLEYGTQQGMHLHFKTQETENDDRMDGGALGRERILYYRELVARYGHHLAMNWNLGEENVNSEAERRAFAQWFFDNDPYRHNVVLHTFPARKVLDYTPLLGTGSRLSGLSLQGNTTDFRDVFPDTLEWVQASAAAGRRWVVAYDEPGDARFALRPNSNRGNSWEDGRKNALWGNVMAGGAGVEFYFGFAFEEADLTCQNLRSRDGFWDFCRYMLEFFEDNNVPFQNMSNQNSLVSNADAWCLRQTNNTYVVYLREGGTTSLNLNGTSGNFQVRWFDPRNGGNLQLGSVANVSSGGNRFLGAAPSSPNQDWIVLVRRNPGANLVALDPQPADLNSDPDGDGLPNAIEAWLGTNPNVGDIGLTNASSDGLTFTFEHPRNANAPAGLSGTYQWSTNLTDWYEGDGVDGPENGPTVTVSSAENAASTSVTATASEPLPRLMIRIRVTSDAPGSADR